MRNLNIDELESKIQDYALDVEYIEKQHLKVKLTQFINFLESQPISNRILNRFFEDYQELYKKIPQENSQNWRKSKKELVNDIKTPEFQGALGYFLIRQTLNSPRLNNNSFFDLTHQWFESRGDFDQWKDDFNTFIFKPFVELLNWYISESQSYNSKDYFSKLEISEFNEKLTDLEEKITNLGFGQEIIFDEIQELNELLKSLKKKNWSEIFKGKLMDLVIGKVISIEAMEMALKLITGEEIKILN
jgi:hypothetical protein